jgi:hypothetical protein
LIVPFVNLFKIIVDFPDTLLNPANVIARIVNFRIDPIVQSLLFSQALQDGVNRAQGQTPKYSRDDGASHGKDKPAAIGPGTAEGSEEILHRKWRPPESEESAVHPEMAGNL